MSGGGKLADHRRDRQIQREDVVAGPQQGVEVGPAAGPLAKQVVELAAGNPPAFVVELQPPARHGRRPMRAAPGFALVCSASRIKDIADRGRIDPRDVAHLPAHPLDAEIDDHFAEVEVEEFRRHGLFFSQTSSCNFTRIIACRGGFQGSGGCLSLPSPFRIGDGHILDI